MYLLSRPYLQNLHKMDADQLPPETELLPLVSVTNNGKLEVNEKTVTGLVEAIGDHPINVLSIVGGEKQSKTMLTGFFIRYLKASEDGENDWIDSNNDERPLQEIEWKRDGSSPDTPGIWAYHRPFLLDGDDDKVAVILLYTQLVSTERGVLWSEDKTVGNIFGMTLCLSSHVVFNIFRQVDEMTLFGLAAAADKCGEERSEGKDDIRLSFLIRDWPFAEDIPYGAQGGTDVINEKLKIKARQSREEKRSRDLISKYFRENTSAFLLPFPGFTAIAKEFSGSLKELGDGDQFVKLMQEFIEKCNPNAEGGTNFRKDENSDKMTAKGWQSMLEDFAKRTAGLKRQMTLADKLNTKHQLAPREQLQLVNRSSKKYEDVWRKQVKNKPFLAVTELRRIHGIARKQAAGFLQEDIDAEGQVQKAEDLKKKLTKKLDDEVEDKFQELIQRNTEKKRDRVNEITADFLGEFEDCLKEKFPVGKKIEQKAMRSRSKKIINQYIKDFEEDIGYDDDAEDDEDGSFNPVRNLADKFNQVLDIFIENRFSNTNADEESDDFDDSGSTSSSRAQSVLGGRNQHSPQAQRGFDLRRVPRDNEREFPPGRVQDDRRCSAGGSINHGRRDWHEEMRPRQTSNEPRNRRDDPPPRERDYRRDNTNYSDEEDDDRRSDRHRPKRGPSQRSGRPQPPDNYEMDGSPPRPTPRPRQRNLGLSREEAVERSPSDAGSMSSFRTARTYFKDREQKDSASNYLPRNWK